MSVRFKNVRVEKMPLNIRMRRKKGNRALVIVFLSRPFLRLRNALIIVFLRPQNWSRLKPYY